jgi:hypothetical protein
VVVTHLDRDLRLGHPGEELQQQNSPLAIGRRIERLSALDAFQCVVLRTGHVEDRRPVGLTAPPSGTSRERVL